MQADEQKKLERDQNKLEREQKKLEREQKKLEREQKNKLEREQREQMKMVNSLNLMAPEGHGIEPKHVRSERLVHDRFLAYLQERKRQQDGQQQDHGTATSSGVANREV